MGLLNAFDRRGGGGMGAMAGGPGGAGGLGGFSAAPPAAGGGLRQGLEAMLRMRPPSGPGFEAAKQEVAVAVARFAGNPAAQRIMSARNADELLQIADELERGGGAAASAMQRAPGLSQF